MISMIRTSALNQSVKRRIFAGNFYTINELHFIIKIIIIYTDVYRNSKKYFQKAALVRRLIKNDFDVVFNEVDALLTPTCSHTAPFYSEIKFEKFSKTRKKDDYFTQPANIAGKLNYFNKKIYLKDFPLFLFL